MAKQTSSDTGSQRYARPERQRHSVVYGSGYTKAKENDLLHSDDPYDDDDEARTRIKMERMERHMSVAAATTTRRRRHTGVSSCPFDQITAHESLVTFLGKRLPSSELPKVEKGEDYAVGEATQAFLEALVSSRAT
mmetsp:Transcript_46506/g.69229  ORF Transcript_46506/g.69229 Transcript_46506/m.69229 type:complete len:136 (-) Transcript_46506:644-1051(-)|eukprot:CAMPEP_0194068910 /NCGR_PEP_ID=MMETSP0009_2-20130614/87352_1 /TAXON_ID=210454 /ORGANISM="Grammatophora oceanica, Strain CCMP 410" /LENGTH=135 /DNA_ID=CAMNT_0038722049 /DNA_START=307 /DNA_END=714 /DNA_ORIENTATION=-